MARSTGHRRFYAAVFSDGLRVGLVKQHDGERRVLASRAWPYEKDIGTYVQLCCAEDEIELVIDGRQVLKATDTTHSYRHGGAGFLIERGTMLADGITVAAVRARGSGAP